MKQKIKAKDQDKRKSEVKTKDKRRK